jgi:hypothetical protein
MKTVPLSKAREDMRGAFGPPPQVGWKAALNAEGRVCMTATLGALDIFEMNATVQGWTVATIVEG